MSIAPRSSPKGSSPRGVPGDGWLGGPGRDFAPVNYQFCAGSGADGGDPNNADGSFCTNSRVKLSQIVDGLSKTAWASESLLGPGVVRFYTPGTIQPRPDLHVMVPTVTGTGTAGISDATCLAAPSISPTRQYSWADGNYFHGMYNHQYGPNSLLFDCAATFQGVNYSWKGARSRHPGGVWILYGDGSVTFAGDAIDRAAWRAKATRAGNEAEDAS